MSKFWDILQHLIDTSTLVIDRPLGSRHPNFSEIIYPLDYGYLEGTSGGDGDGIDVWCGTTAEPRQLVATLATVDPFKRDAELKLLVNCSVEQIETIMQFMAEQEMGYYLIERQAESD